MIAHRLPRLAVGALLAVLPATGLAQEVAGAAGASVALAAPAVRKRTHWAPPREEGIFILHKIGNPIGRETWHITSEPSGARHLSTDFTFTDRGTAVTLTATLDYAAGGRPAHLTLTGQTSRMSTVALDVTLVGDSARIREDSSVTTVLAKGAFPARGYAPMAIQQAVMRDWLRRGRPASLRLVPAATLHITARGTDTITVTDRSIILRRYSVAGLIWGRETLWLDARGNLVAVATVDAEFDPVQAVREGFESAAGTFVKLAAADAIAALSGSAGTARRTDTVIALVGGTLVDGTGAPPVPNAAVVIRGAKIVAVGARGAVDIPRGARVVNTAGTTMLPGLWEMHAHYAQVEWGPIYLASGITTARDVGNQLDFLLGAREVLNSGHGIGPRLLAAGIIDGDAPTGIGLARAATPEQGVAWVRRYHEAGLEQIKVYSSLSPEVLQAITTEAHALGMTVTGHVPRGMDGYQGVAAGMDQINHVTFIYRMMRARGDSTPLTMDMPEAQKAISFLLEHHIVVDPTAALFELNAHPADQPVSAFEPGVDKVAPELRQALTHTGAEPAEAAQARAQFRTLLEIIGALHRAGVPIVAGTDLTVPGYSLHREMELYVQAGFTPMEAIQSATSVPARAMGLEQESGTLQPGMRADVLVVNGNPLERISDTRNVRFVIAGGRYFDPAPLWKSVGFTP
ncbi:MAG: amidohydrolase [Gemmatimonadetes bacterium]|nr:amidohydrolase [Gemmatimonadota bacterium]